MRRALRVRRLRMRGFTFIETLIVVTMLTLAIAAVVSLLNTADGLVEGSRAHVRAVAENRKGLKAVADALRGVDLGTLEGFDGAGTSVNPSFQRVRGMDLDGRLLDDPEELRWQTVATQVDGISNPGAVHIVKNGASRRIAARVMPNGFSIHQLGSTLVIRLKTYYATSERRVVVVEGETAVSTRN